jgi:hypothetical protein
MSGDLVHIILTCTKRKTHPPVPELELHRVQGTPLEARAAAWIERLRSYDGQRLPVGDLYAGDHWQIGRSLQRIAERTGRRATTWACSAGYGLLALDAPVAPYSATFSSAHADAVTRGLSGLAYPEGVRRWWDALSRWEGPVPGAPRTFREVAEIESGAAMWIIASAPYLRAAADDVAAAAEALGEPGRLSVFSAGADSVRELRPFRLPYDLRMRERVGGAAMSLNVRVARELLSTGASLDRDVLADALRGMTERLTRTHRPHRRAMTNEEVLRFLREHLQREPGLACTPLLRRLRDEEQRACEQKRFGEFYRRVRREIVDGP